jgi:outer membrane protein
MHIRKKAKTLQILLNKQKNRNLMDMQKRIQDFQTNAQTQLQNKQDRSFPAYLYKVDKAIKDVGKENGFLYVFDVAKGALLYFDESKSI